MSLQTIKEQYNKLKELYMKLAGSPPAKDYPPQQIATYIKMCKEVGRDDLGQKIMDGFNNSLEKYSSKIFSYRNSTDMWKACVPIVTNSITKNVFKYKTFQEWLKSETENAPSAVLQKAKSLGDGLDGIPAIAIPKKEETIDDWAAQAEKTKERIANIKMNMNNNSAFIATFQEEISDLKRKIEEYGPGGSKGKTKSGKPSALASRIPGWKRDLELIETAVNEAKSELEKAKKKFDKAEDTYRSSNVITVEFEKRSQSMLDVLSKSILNEPDFEKQKDMLKKFNELVKKLDEEGGKAASMERSAAFWDTISKALTSVVDYFASAWKALKKWTGSILSKIDDFEKFATEQGRY